MDVGIRPKSGNEDIGLGNNSNRIIVLGNKPFLVGGICNNMKSVFVT